MDGFRVDAISKLYEAEHLKDEPPTGNKNLHQVGSIDFLFLSCGTVSLPTSHYNLQLLT